MSANPWVKWFAGDYLNGVADLGPNEGWVYTVVLNLIFDSGAPIADDITRLARRCNMRPTSVEKAVDLLVSTGKLTRREGVISNTRAEQTVKSRSKLVDNSTKAANTRWEKVRENSNENNETAKPAHSTGNADAMLYQKPEAREPSGSYSDPDGSGAETPPDLRKQLFDEGLKSLVRQTGKPEGRCRPLIGKWLKASRDDCRLVLSKIRQAEADRVADPVPWIGEAIKPAWSTDPVERQMRQSF
ncbi:DUF1376 domain-containing protein [Aurantimonas coralicida]|uniref:DUF1376 domain-containing protein n=1 Tax=Aurantimonas coralicida TaxID=182270 RepID=UPI001E38082E|nr:DUF1376 domain-containing protein [Aurantimonas coralicida]MCD1644801.1 YdaU family protein [Aurantimonas coralicida]